MTDRLVYSAWWLVVMCMICAAGMVTLYIGYRGLFELLAKRWDNGAISLVVAVATAMAAIQLCRHRNDLVA